MRKPQMLGLAVLAALPLAASETNTWSCATVNNTPLTALDWSAADNWSLGHAPASGDDVKWCSIDVNKPQYVQLPIELTLNRLNLAYSTVRSPVLIGEALTIQPDVGGNLGYLSRGTIYADVSLQAGTTWLSETDIAGRLLAPSAHVIPASGWMRHRLDLYATSAEAVRTDDLQVGANYAVFPGNANFAVYVAGAEASSSAWTLTEGSPYITLKDASAAVVAVGAAVTGEGIPEGTWVRRWFSSTQLELSQAATATAASNTLAFAAFHPDARVHVPTYQRQGEDGSALKLGRRCAADALRFEIDTFRNVAVKDGNYWLHGLEASDLATWQPGTLVLHDVTDSHALRPGDRLRNCHIEFAGTASGGATTFGERRIVAFDTGVAGAVARLTVPEGKTGAIANFTNFTGTVVKDGAGTLTIGLADAENAGAISVEAGTLALTARASAGTAGVSFASLTLAAGATLQLPATGLRVAAATFGDGVTVRGPGVLRVAGAKTGRVTCEDGATVVYEVGAANDYVHAPEAKVAGHPAFWVDASKADSLVLKENDDGTTSVTRWNDCRAGETMFCTNVVKAPTYVSDGTPAGTYVKIAYESTHWYTNTQGLVWSQPIRDIHAVFLVQDPTDGGGEILGRTSRLPNNYYGSQGGPYYASRSSWSSSLICPNYATERVKFGRFFLNGTEVRGYESGYLGAFMQLVEHHVNESKWAGSASRTLACDAFGTGGYVDGHVYNNANGRQRIAECLIYTNALTHAERVQTALYLARKWLGKDIAYSEFDEPLDGTSNMRADLTLAAGETISVAAGTAGGAHCAEGGAPLVKDGEGLFVVGSLAAGDVTVNAGELRVKSLSLANDSVPAGAWVHVDAADDASFVDLGADGTVAKWRNLADDTMEYRPLYGAPKRVANALNGRALVDCGTMNGDGKGSMVLYDSATGAYKYTHTNNGSENFIAGAPYLASTFIVFGSQGGGNSLLGCWGNGFPFQGLAHYPLDTVNAKTVFMKKTKYEAWNDAQVTSFTSGANVARLNGEAFDPFSTPFSGGYDLLTVTTEKLNRKSDTLAVYGQLDECVGGLSYGEVLIYTNRLDAATQTKVEAYLRKKWFDVDTTGLLRATCGALRVAKGAVLTVGDWAAAQGGDAYTVGAGAITATALGGDGTVRGDVALAANGALEAALDADGAVAALTVEGTLALPGACTVRVADGVAQLPAGRYTLVSATAITGAADVTWSIAAPTSPRRSYTVRVAGNTLELVISDPSTVIILR